MRFKAYAKVHKFKEAMGTDPKNMMPAKISTTLDPSKDSHKPRIEAKKRNETAIACPTMAFINEEQLGYINEAMTTDYPDGLAYLVVRQLLDKYKPQNTISRMELRHQLNQITMKPNKDPKRLFEKIRTIKNIYNGLNCKIDEEDLIALVLNVAPEKYKAVLTNEQRLRKLDGNFKLKHLQEAIKDH